MVAQNYIVPDHVRSHIFKTATSIIDDRSLVPTVFAVLYAFDVDPFEIGLEEWKDLIVGACHAQRTRSIRGIPSRRGFQQNAPVMAAG